jgi:hypothetical protein
MIATRPPVISARDDTIAPYENGSHSGIRARRSKSLFRFSDGSSHEFFVHIHWRHELKV